MERGREMEGETERQTQRETDRERKKETLKETERRAERKSFVCVLFMLLCICLKYHVRLCDLSWT